MFLRTWLLSRKRHILMVIAVVAILVSASFAVLYRDVLEDAFPLWGPRPNEEWIMKTDPNLKVRGIIEEIKLNHRRDAFSSYHRFPAVILLNETETLWTSVPLMWKNKTRVMVGYDYRDVGLHNFSVGIPVEVNGYWFPILDSSYSNMIVVGPLIYGSYVKPLSSFIGQCMHAYRVEKIKLLKEDGTRFRTLKP